MEKTILNKRQLNLDILDFDIKYNNLFLLHKPNKISQYSLSSEYAHVSLQTNVYDLAANGTNQSLIRASIFSEANEFLPQQPLTVLNLQPIDLLTLYSNKQYTSLTCNNSTGDIAIPLYPKDITDSLYMHPNSIWEFELEDFKLIQEIRIKFDEFRPGDIAVDLLTADGWVEVISTTLPLLFTREDLVLDNFFDNPNITMAGVRIRNLTSNTLSLRKVMLLELQNNSTELNITNYTSDTGQTIFYASSIKTALNELTNPRFAQKELFWDFEGYSYVVQESVVENSFGAHLHAVEDTVETFVKQTVALNQTTPQIITGSLFVKGNIISAPTNGNLGLKLTLRDIDNNEAVYFRTFSTGQYDFKQSFLTVIPDFPVNEVDYEVICQKDVRGSIQIDKCMLQQSKLSDYTDNIIQKIFLKVIYEF